MKPDYYRVEQRRGGWNGATFLKLFLALVIIGMALLVAAVVLGAITASNSAMPPPPAPPAPPPVLTAAACTWCDELLELSGANLVGQAARARQTAGCTELRQSDFDAGTFIISQDNTCWFLGEDIYFNPVPHKDHRAVDEPYASDPSFVFDFFAAIVIRARNVVLDLNGFTLQQSTAHFVAQRFYANIELAVPFLSGDGPADFGSTVFDIGEITIRNGVIGRTAHHAIHGNGGFDLLLDELVIKDYELAGVALNGANRVVMNRVRLLGTLTDAPVRATWSQARYIKIFVERALTLAQGQGGAVATAAAKLQTAQAALDVLMTAVTDDLVVNGHKQIQHAEARALFHNPSGRQYGTSTYGIIVHNFGSAVNAMECDRTAAKNDFSHHVLLQDCEIHQTTQSMIEVVALQHMSSTEMQRGPGGDIFRIEEVMTADGRYDGDVLSDVQVALGMLWHLLGKPAGFGTIHMHPTLLGWADTGAQINDLVQNGVFRYIRGGDAMFHVPKGSFGLRLAGGHHYAVRRSIVSGVENYSPPGHSKTLPGEAPEDVPYVGALDGGHPGLGPEVGFPGTDARAVSIEAASGVLFSETTFRNVFSAFGHAGGISVHHDSANVLLHDIVVDNVTAYFDDSVAVPGLKQPRAVGLVVTTDAQAPTILGSFSISNVRAGKAGLACDTIVENRGQAKCEAPDVNFFEM